MSSCAIPAMNSGLSPSAPLGEASCPLVQALVQTFT